MPYRICKTIEIENGHMLSKHPDCCRFPHGHTRKVEFTLEAETLDQNEMVCDFKILKEVMADFLDSWDHAMAMNTQDPGFEEMRARYGSRVIAFEGEDPTTEVMARTLYHTCRDRLKTYASRVDAKYRLQTSARLVKVRLWETSSSWAEYWE